MAPSPAFAYAARREPVRGTDMTGGLVNGDYDASVTPGEIVERPRQSEIPCRPSRSQVAFGLHPIDMMGAVDFLIRKVVRGKTISTPRGRFTTMDERRNIGIPPGVPYGTLVGDMSGVAPYGLE